MTATVRKYIHSSHTFNPLSTVYEHQPSAVAVFCYLSFKSLYIVVGNIIGYNVEHDRFRALIVLQQRLYGHPKIRRVIIVAAIKDIPCHFNFLLI